MSICQIGRALRGAVLLAALSLAAGACSSAPTDDSAEGSNQAVGAKAGTPLQAAVKTFARNYTGKSILLDQDILFDGKLGGIPTITTLFLCTFYNDAPESTRVVKQGTKYTIKGATVGFDVVMRIDLLDAGTPADVHILCGKPDEVTDPDAYGKVLGVSDVITLGS